MNSYPPELLVQLAPVMFVAGLDLPPSASSSPPPPPPTSLSPTITPPSTPRSYQDPFHTLIARLRDALLAQRPPAIWNPDKSKSFHIVLVDPGVRFPPRKLESSAHHNLISNPNSVPSAPLSSTFPINTDQGPAHSPLSPMTPSSPLYPDGLIAPIWIRKHTTLVPAVFVLFLRIYEHPFQAPRSPLLEPDHERENEERRRDTELSAEVAQRKKSLSERGIKLTVVLIASRRMLDDPSLDARLTYIRRHSTLDSRAALFVLSPVSQAELGDFVKSLQQALYEPAVEYYTAHSKRVRRKRNRHAQAWAPTPAVTTRPLRPEGWTVRYEYKMACFAEFRGEDEVALKHYQDAYTMLVTMFGSIIMLPPRTKRWAEAKVLADCINIKVIKLYLYNNEHALALSHHNTHIRRFGDFSRGWGIGEETFEFWSWMARQHRILAELLEQGTRSTLIIPVHKPTPSPISSSQVLPPATSSNPLGSIGTSQLTGVNPKHALQHPGFYYYMAGRCTEMRREQFLVAVDAELNNEPIALSPGFANEKKVDHLNIILELYTKAYELFKKYSTSATQAQGRLTLWIAFRIAQTYHDAGKFDMAVRFFERIAKTYRREKWATLLRPLLATWYACAQRLGDVELGISLLVEMLGHECPEGDEPGALEEDLIAVLKSTVPTSPDNILKVDLSESQPIFDSDVVFWSSSVKVNEAAAFQLSLTAPTDITISSLPIQSLTLHFSEGHGPVVIHHILESDQQTLAPASVRYVRLGHVSATGEPVEVEADLRWALGSTIVFAGTMGSNGPAVLKITELVVKISENGWNIAIPFQPCRVKQQGSTLAGRWLSSIDPVRFIAVERDDRSAVIVKHRVHNLSVSFIQHQPAYLDEDYPIIIEVINADDRALEVHVEVLLQPSEIDNAVNSIAIDEEVSSGLIKGVSLGVLAPGASVMKTLHLFSQGGAGERMLDISIQSQAKIEGEDENKDEDQEDGDRDTDDIDTMETLQTLIVPTVAPFTVNSDVVFRRSLGEWTGVADLDTFDDANWDDRGGEALVSITMGCVGPHSLMIENVRLEREDNEHSRILDSSLDVEDNDMYPSEYLPGDEFEASCRISIAPSEVRHLDRQPIPPPGKYIVEWHRILKNGEHGPLSRSIITLPTLHPPKDEIIALLSVPPIATLHVPLPMTLIVRNYHDSRSANITVYLEPDQLDGFVVAGLRTGSLPVLLPGAEERVTWKLIPIECGYINIPQLRVVNRRPAVAQVGGEQTQAADTGGEVIRIVNVQGDQRRGGDDAVDAKTVEDDVSQGRQLGTVLVLPP